MRGKASISSVDPCRLGRAAATLMPLVDEIQAHVFAAQRIHADDTTVPVLAKGQDPYRPIMDLCARRPTLCGPRSASGSVLLFATAVASIPSNIWPATPG